jgi:putative ABC transport system ATP-binding protein
MTAALEVVDAVREYPGEPPVRALAGVSLTIDAGELVAVVGRSGSGKSTLMHLAGALDTPTTGTVRVSGYDIAELTDGQRSALRAHHVGFVFQQFFLDPHRSALANVADGLLYAGARRAQREAAAQEALVRVGLGHRLDHSPGKLSGGERQRVAVARAVVGRPSLVLADEPTGNLDQASGAAVMEVLRGLQGAGAAVVIVTHDHTMAADLPRRIEIADGRIVSDTNAGSLR